MNLKQMTEAAGNMIKNALKTIVAIKIAPYIIVGVILAIIIAYLFGGGGNDNMAESVQGNIQQALNEALGEGISGDVDITSIVEIKGDDSTGYYLEFIDGADQILQRVIDKDRAIFDALDITSTSTLKKFIKAEMTTRFPHLGARMTGKGGGGMSGSIDGLPDFTDLHCYPHEGSYGYCQWFAEGRIMEVFGIDLARAALGSNRAKYGDSWQDWLVRTYPDWFELSDEPAPGAGFYGKDYDHIGFVNSVDFESGTMVVEEGNAGYDGEVRINWTEYGIRGRDYPYYVKRTVSIEDFSSHNGYCVPIGELRDKLDTTGTSSSSSSSKSNKNIDSIEGFLFIGDSLTVGMSNSVLNEERDGVIIRAVGSSSPGEWLDDLMVAQPGGGYLPTWRTLPDEDIEYICIMLGTNMKTGVEGESQNMKALLEKLHNEKYPNATIFVQKLIPEYRGYWTR